MKQNSRLLLIVGMFPLGLLGPVMMLAGVLTSRKQARAGA
jgi:hypothetical protein